VNLRPPPTINQYRSLNASTLDRWSSATPEGADSVLIDLSLATFVDPMALTTIAAVAENAAASGLDIEFVPPQDQNIRRYVARMHLGECLGRYCSNVDLPKVNERDTEDRLFELHRFDADSSDDLAESVFRAHKKAGGSSEDTKSFFKGVSEVLNNVVDHSGAAGGWAAMQVMPKDDGLIKFAVADAGYGLEHTLRRYNKVDGPVDAVKKAFERTVSGTGQLGRGAGLDDLLQRIKRHKGHLRAWSGTGAGRSSGGALACREVTAAFPGTVIYAGFKPEQKGVPT
jgi:anti-sigma regulatory factor (Ser/Thr protein kinase)